MKVLLALAFFNFIYDFSLADSCRVGCQYVSFTGVPSGGCGINYQEALLVAQKNCITNILALTELAPNTNNLGDTLIRNCQIPSSEEGLLKLHCSHFTNEREFFERWKKSVCLYKKEIVFTKNLIWSKWYQCD